MNDSMRPDPSNATLHFSVGTILSTPTIFPEPPSFVVTALPATHSLMDCSSPARAPKVRTALNANTAIILIQSPLHQRIVTYRTQRIRLAAGRRASVLKAAPRIDGCRGASH